MKLLLENDQIVNRDDVVISYLDRGYVFGDGIYEVFRVYNGQMFEADAHYDRLERSLREVRINLPYPLERLDNLLREMVKLERLEEGIVYLQITRGAAPRIHSFPENAKPVLTAYCSEMARPHDAMRQGINVITRPDIRWLRCDIKTLNLLPNVMAKQEALDHGVKDVIFHREGTVTESSSSNVMMIRDGSIYTHPANHLILHGVTRLVLIDLAKELDIPFIEKAFTLEELLEAEEVFLASTTSEVMPVTAIDGCLVRDGQPGPITSKLQEAFQRLIEVL